MARQGKEGCQLMFPGMPKENQRLPSVQLNKFIFNYLHRR